MSTSTDLAWSLSSFRKQTVPARSLKLLLQPQLERHGPETGLLPFNPHKPAFPGEAFLSMRRAFKLKKRYYLWPMQMQPPSLSQRNQKSPWCFPLPLCFDFKSAQAPKEYPPAQTRGGVQQKNWKARRGPCYLMPLNQRASRSRSKCRTISRWQQPEFQREGRYESFEG
jgi:hypothetical protein